MNVYEGCLKFVKETRAMIVFGNADLRAQYYPKSMFKKFGKKPPTEVMVSITLPVNPVGNPRQKK